MAMMGTLLECLEEEWCTDDADGWSPTQRRRSRQHDHCNDNDSSDDHSNNDNSNTDYVDDDYGYDDNANATQPQRPPQQQQTLPTPTTTTQQPQQPPRPSSLPPSPMTEPKEFEVRMFRKTCRISIGLSVIVLEDGLLIEGCFEDMDEYDDGICSPSNLVAAWNAMCGTEEQLRIGDKIISCNGITDPNAMLNGICEIRGAIRLAVLRGPFEVPLRPAPSESWDAAEHPDCFGSADGLRDSGKREQEKTRTRTKAETELLAMRDSIRIEHEKRKEERANARSCADTSGLQMVIADRLAKSRGFWFFHC